MCLCVPFIQRSLHFSVRISPFFSYFLCFPIFVLSIQSYFPFHLVCKVILILWLCLQLLVALQKFGNNLDDYLHLVLPPIVRLFDAGDCPINVRRSALETVDHLAESLDFTDFASRIIHPLVRTLDTCPELRVTAMDTLCSLVVQLGRKYHIFIPLVHKVIMKHRITSTRYEMVTCKIVTVSETAFISIRITRKT